MSLTQIGRNSYADVKLTEPGSTLKSYRCQFTQFEPDAQTPEERITSFCDETGGAYEAGEYRMIVDFAGLAKKGDSSPGSDGAAILGVLLANPFNVASVWQFEVGCTIAGSFNYSRCRGRRIAGGNATFAGTAGSTGAVVITWDNSGT